jgi:adenylate cyclase
MQPSCHDDLSMFSALFSPIFASVPNSPVAHSSNHLANNPSSRDSEISPGSAPPDHHPQLPRPMISRSRQNSAIAPWETQPASELDNYRRDLSHIDSPTPRPPQGKRQIPSVLSPPPQGFSNGNGSFPRPTSVFGSFYDDSSEDVAGLSPGFRPGSSQDDMEFPTDDRRPSVASATTVSSIGSKSSVGRNYHKRLNAFFGEDFPGVEAASRQGSDSPLPLGAMLGHGQSQTGNNGIGSSSSLTPTPDQSRRQRNNSTNTTSKAPQISRPGSPASFTGHPKTPHASEVTPWEFQDAKVRICCFPPPFCSAALGDESIKRRDSSNCGRPELELFTRGGYGPEV